MEVKGRNLLNGLPTRITVTSEDTREATLEVTAQVIDAIHGVLEITPPELVSDIAEQGIILTGGGSLLYGLDILVKEHTGIEANVSDGALESVALGAGKSVSFANRVN